MYEFIVAAYSSVGVGEYSDPSIPISTNINKSNPPVNLHLLRNVKQATANRVRGEEDEDDPNKLCPFDTREADEYDSSDDDDVGWGYEHSTGAFMALGTWYRAAGWAKQIQLLVLMMGELIIAFHPVRRAYASGTGRRETSRVHCMCLKSAYSKIQRWARATLHLRARGASCHVRLHILYAREFVANSSSFDSCNK